MILSHSTRSYFLLLQAKVSQGMARYGRPIPYFVEDDPVIANYELIRAVWLDGLPIKRACQRHSISRSQYYEEEERFVEHGLLGLFPEVKTLSISTDLERLVVMVSKARCCLSQQAIMRIAEAVPATQEAAGMEAISQILASYGRSVANRPADIEFWSRIQRTLNELNRLKQVSIKGRDKKKKGKTFFQDADPYHKRLELLREIFFNQSAGIKEVCLQYGISPTSFYRLIKDYRLFGPWAVIPGNLPGKETMPWPPTPSACGSRRGP